MASDAPPQGVRARARAELLADVSRIARSHLAESGAGGLSVRAIARELGLVSSALYRYFPSRDALLTQLIIEAYDELGEAVETSEAACDREDLAGRYRAASHAVRNWAKANPNEYALIYGSPVPGYAAPDDTIDPAVRVAVVLSGIASDLDPGGISLRTPSDLTPGLQQQFAAMATTLGLDVDPRVLLLGVTQWAQLFGMVSFELFGTFNNAFDDADELFAAHVDLGLTAFGLS
jgi:AcrR family transcriptional regulator